MNYIARFARPHAAVFLGLSVSLTSFVAVHARERTPAYELSKDFRAAARNAQAALDLGDVASSMPQIVSLEALAATPAEKYAASALRMQLAAKQADPQAQRKALTAMLESGGAPASEIPYLRYLAGYFSYILNELNDSIAQLSYAHQLGYQTPQSTLLLADAHLRAGRMAEGLALLNEAMKLQKAASGIVDPAWYDRATAMSYKLKDWAGLAGWYRQKLADYPSPQNWRSAIVNYLDNPALSPAMKLDLYRLLSAGNGLASERDYHAYAAAAAQNGQHGEVKAVVDAGRAAGELLAKDPATTSIYKTASARAARDKAALATLAGKAGKAAEAADGYLAIGDYARAAELYRKALAEAPADPGQLNTRLGIALTRAGNVQEAQQVLSAVTGPWRDVAQFWLVWAGQAGVIQPTQG